MIRFLKRHVWPWSEIERLRRAQGRMMSNFECVFAKWQQAECRASCLEGDIRDLNRRLAQYERPHGKDGRFARND